MSDGDGFEDSVIEFGEFLDFAIIFKLFWFYSSYFGLFIAT